MQNIDISQAEADSLIQMPKHRVDGQAWSFPLPGQKSEVDLLSLNGRERFKLTLYRGKLNLEKGTHQTRTRGAVILARLCFGGKPHTNPDGTVVGAYHLHLYREGYGDKWATEPSSDNFVNLRDPARRLTDFLRLCRVVDVRELEPELWSWSLN